MNIDIRIDDAPLSVDACIESVRDERAGAVNVFIGTVRNQTNRKDVSGLDFEAYEKMAVSEMRKVAANAHNLFEVFKVSIHHRTGSLKIGEIPVVIAVSAAHRDAAFKACRYCIDTLKETVPIWKKEIFEDGEVWVAAHP